MLRAGRLTSRHHAQQLCADAFWVWPPYTEHGPKTLALHRADTDRRLLASLQAHIGLPEILGQYNLVGYFMGVFSLRSDKLSDQRPMGPVDSTLLKKKLMESSGWKVESLSLAEWPWVVKSSGAPYPGFTDQLKVLLVEPLSNAHIWPRIDPWASGTHRLATARRKPSYLSGNGSLCTSAKQNIHSPTSKVTQGFGHMYILYCKTEPNWHFHHYFTF